MSKILVIDDDSITRLFLKRALQAQGHEVAIATNGREGIEQARSWHPSLIICDWIMPEANGLEVCRQVRDNPRLSTSFFILLTSRTELADRIEALNAGADDFLGKPIDVNELQARVRSGLRLCQLNQDLQLQKQILEAEFLEAAAYVRSLLPSPLSGRVKIDSCFIPSRELGGDCFDYFWLDPDYLVIYLLDVSGHGLGAALPSSLILNLIRLQSLPDVDFYQPEAVLRGLNDAFQMTKQNEKYFTIWYGIYDAKHRQLTYASAGHPPAILVAPTQATQVDLPQIDLPQINLPQINLPQTNLPQINPIQAQIPDAQPSHVQQLRTPNLPIGLMEESHFLGDRIHIPANSTLYLYSDGIYDLCHTQYRTWNLNLFIELLVRMEPERSPDDILKEVHQFTGLETFEDDLSLLKIQFE
jgi:phosphoserine phosphatase RsbU/P